MPRQPYHVEQSDGGGEATITAGGPEWAADTYAEDCAKSGDLMDDDTMDLTVTGPDGEVTKWRATCHMEPSISVQRI